MFSISSKVTISVCTDTELVALLKQGNEGAFAEIYERYSMKIFYQVYHVLQDEEEAKDLVQDLFITLWRKPERLHVDVNLGGYLYISARNRVFKVIRKQRVQRDYLSSIASFITDVCTETLDSVDERELRKLIQQEIDRLPPKMKEVFELSRNEHLSHKEIGEKLNISTHTVKKQVHNALNTLRLKLGSNLPAGLFLLLFLKK